MALRRNTKENIEIKNKIIELTYNPYYITTTVNFYNLDFEKLTKTSELLKLNQNNIMQYWIENFLENLFLELNDDSLNFLFNGRETDYQDIKKILESYPNSSIKYNNLYTSTNLKEQLEKNIINLKNIVTLNNLDINISNYTKLFKNEIKVAVMAPMSSGKSTFLNALIGKDILPSENAACTSKIFEIINNKKLKNGEFEYRTVENSTPLTEWTPLEESILKNLNNDSLNKNIKIEIAGNIDFLSNENYNIRLIDTPGPNNSNNRNHRIESLNFIKNDNDCIILYILDATNLTTNDSGIYLEEIADFLNKNEKNKYLSEKIIFILNKFDELSPSKNEDCKIFEEAITFLKSKQIKNPKIFPISSILVKSLRKGIELLKEEDLNDELYEELENFNYIKSKFVGRRAKMNTLNFSPLSKSIKEKLNSEEDLYKKLENLSGITAIESYIHTHINRYYLVRQQNLILEKLLSDINSEIQKLTLSITSNKSTLKKMKEDRLKKSKNVDNINLFIENFNIEESLNKIDQAYTKHLYNGFDNKKRQLIASNGNTAKKKETISFYEEIKNHLNEKNDQFDTDLKTILNTLKENLEIEVFKKLKEYTKDFNYNNIFSNLLLDFKIEIEQTEIIKISNETEIEFKFFEFSSWISIWETKINLNDFLGKIEIFVNESILSHQNKTKNKFKNEIELLKKECQKCFDKIIIQMSKVIQNLEKKDNDIIKLEQIKIELTNLQNNILNLIK